MRSKLCRHTTCVVCTLLLFSSFLPVNWGCFYSCVSPATPSRSLYHLPFMTQFPLLCSRIWLSLPRFFIIFLLFPWGEKKNKLRKYDVSSSVSYSDAVPGITAGTTSMGRTGGSKEHLQSLHTACPAERIWVALKTDGKDRGFSPIKSIKTHFLSFSFPPLLFELLL